MPFFLLSFGHISKSAAYLLHIKNLCGLKNVATSLCRNHSTTEFYFKNNIENNFKIGGFYEVRIPILVVHTTSRGIT